VVAIPAGQTGAARTDGGPCPGRPGMPAV